MSACLVLNDASLPFDSAEECKASLDEFFVMLHSAHSQGLRFYRSDDIEGDWNSLIFAQAFDLGQWMNEISDRDQSRLVHLVVSNVMCPLISIDRIDHKKSIQDMLFVLSSDNDVEVLALGVASIINAHGLSFSSRDDWRVDSIPITQMWDENGSFHERVVDVPNVCSMAHVDILLADLQNKKQLNKSYFSSLTIRDNQDFPRLIFCESVLKSLKSSSVSINDHSKILEVLNKLNNAISGSSNLEELIEKSELSISGESVETMKTPKHSRKRKFKHPDLGKTIFELHVKNFSDGKRMHILANYFSETICIGYFGRHLSTVTIPK